MRTVPFGMTPMEWGVSVPERLADVILVQAPPGILLSGATHTDTVDPLVAVA